MPRGVGVQVPMPAPWRVFLQHLKGCRNTRFLYSEFTGGAYVLPVHQELFNLSAQHTATSGFVYSISSTINFFKRLFWKIETFSNDFQRDSTTFPISGDCTDTSKIQLSRKFTFYLYLSCMKVIPYTLH